MSRSELLEVAPWAGITQGTNGVNYASSCFDRKWASFRGRTRNAILVRLACQLVKVPFLFVSQQKATVVFDVALAALPIWNNTFGINWYLALLPNSVGSTAKTHLPWHTILWKHYICSSLRVLWKKLALFARIIRRHQLSAFLWLEITLPHR